MDACLIAAGQRVEHYEIAAYGTLVAWARVMGHDEVGDLLQATLDEEKAADKKLSGIANGGSIRRPPLSGSRTSTRRREVEDGKRAEARGSKGNGSREAGPQGNEPGTRAPTSIADRVSPTGSSDAAKATHRADPRVSSASKCRPTNRSSAC